jgi:hypothetical protein
MLAWLSAAWKSFFSSLLVYMGSFNFFQAAPSEADNYAWAVVVEVKGEVRHKRSHSSLWGLTKIGTALYPGDKVYVEKNSQVLLRYPQLRASVFCSTPSMFSISRDLEHMRFQDKWFALFAMVDPIKESLKDPDGKPIPEPPKPKRDDFLKLLERPGDRDKMPAMSAAKTNDKENERLEELSFGLQDDGGRGNSRLLKFDTGVFAFVRQVEVLEWQFPRGVYDLASPSFPRRISFEVLNVKRNPVLHGYLWSERELTPRWSGVSRGKFTDVPIAAPGRYRIQVFAEDNSATSDVAWINATAEASPGLIPDNWEDGRTRWLDE